LIDLRKYGAVIIFTLLSCLTAAFIFGNSLMDGEASNAVSSDIAEDIFVLIDGIFDLEEGEFHKLVRKAAHFTEFALLGTFLTLLMFSVRRICGRSYYAAVFFGVLAAAVTDEFIQSFTGRTSMVADVLIDFCGAVFGILLTSAVYLGCCRKNGRFG